MQGVTKSVSLRELYVGANPWIEQDLTKILSAYQKPSNLKILGLGIHTYLTDGCVKVILCVKTYLPSIHLKKSFPAC